MLNQKGRPVAFFSEKLAGARFRYSTYDVEIYAIDQCYKTLEALLVPQRICS